LKQVISWILSYPKIYSLAMKLFVARNRRDYLESFIAFIPNQSVLDVGCGPANILRTLNVSIRYTGIDLNPKYVSSATNRFGSFAKFHNLNVDDLANLTLEKFDKILILGTLHHLSDDQVNSLLYTTSRLLNDNGELITHDPVRSINQSKISKTLMDFDRGKYIRFDNHHLSLFNNYFNTSFQIRDDVMRFPYEIIYVKATRK
jgi:SAM-dependent methyltransferase